MPLAEKITFYPMVQIEPAVNDLIQPVQIENAINYVVTHRN